MPTDITALRAAGRARFTAGSRGRTPVTLPGKGWSLSPKRVATARWRPRELTAARRMFTVAGALPHPTAPMTSVESEAGRGHAPLC